MAEGLARAAAAPADFPGLGRFAPDSLTLIVVPDRPSLESLVRGRAPPWGAGLALPSQHAILLRADAGDVYRTLRHELAHLALHGRVRVRLPLWFDEGYAAWAAGEWERLGGLELNLAVARGAVPDFDALDGTLRGSSSAATAGYALAMSAVLELARRNPEGRLDPLLSRLVAGEDFGAAVRATTGLTLPQFEDAWRRSVRTRYTVVTWLVAGGAWALLALGLIVLGGWRRRADRRRRAALDQGWVLPEEPPDASEPLDRSSTP
jgi:peptidase MA superfamily protein